MNKKILLFSILTLVVLATVGISSVSAHGWFGLGGILEPEKVVERQNQMFEQQANLLDINVDKVKDYWAQGKNVREIVTELGISNEDLQAKMQVQRQTRLEQELQILVDNGVITQAQADTRLSAMKNMSTNGKFGRTRNGFMNKKGPCPNNNQDNQ